MNHECLLCGKNILDAERLQLKGIAVDYHLECLVRRAALDSARAEGEPRCDGGIPPARCVLEVGHYGDHEFGIAEGEPPQPELHDTDAFDADGSWSKAQWRRNATYWGEACREAWMYRDLNASRVEELEKEIAALRAGEQAAPGLRDFEEWWKAWLATQTDDFNPKHSALAAWRAALTAPVPPPGLRHRVCARHAEGWDGEQCLGCRSEEIMSDGLPRCVKRPALTASVPHFNPADCSCEHIHASSPSCRSIEPSRGMVKESDRLFPAPVKDARPFTCTKCGAKFGPAQTSHACEDAPTLRELAKEFRRREALFAPGQIKLTYRICADVADEWAALAAPPESGTGLRERVIEAAENLSAGLEFDGFMGHLTPALRIDWEKLRDALKALAAAAPDTLDTSRIEDCRENG